MSIQVVMPKAGLTIVEGTIAEWKVKEGAAVSKGDILMEYENEKNTIECEALASGIIHLVARAGDTVPVGAEIAVLAESQAEYDALASGGAAPAASAAPAAASAPARSGAVGDGHVRASGYAKKLAKEAGIRIADVTATGGSDGTRILARDVEKYLEAGPSRAICSTACRPRRRTPACARST